MSIVMNLYYTGKNGDAQKFAQEMEQQGVADKIRQTEGNERYDYFLSMKDPQTVLLIDEWKDQASLDKHHASETMKEIMALREKYDLHMRAERYQPDQDSISSQDQKFMRK